MNGNLQASLGMKNALTAPNWSIAASMRTRVLLCGLVATAGNTIKLCRMEAGKL
jgi:hypothetical protein